MLNTHTIHIFHLRGHQRAKTLTVCVCVCVRATHSQLYKRRAPWWSSSCIYFIFSSLILTNTVYRNWEAPGPPVCPQSQHSVLLWSFTCSPAVTCSWPVTWWGPTSPCGSFCPCYADWPSTHQTSWSHPGSQLVSYSDPVSVYFCEWKWHQLAWPAVCVCVVSLCLRSLIGLVAVHCGICPLLFFKHLSY